MSGSRSALVVLSVRKPEPSVILHTVKSDFGKKLGWSFPGEGEQSSFYCGTLAYSGCPNSELHSSHLPGVDCCSDGKVFVKQYRRSCFKKDCPKCYRRWIGREVVRASDRLVEGTLLFKKYRWPSHVVSSPDRDLWSLPIEELRKCNTRALSASGVVGGCSIFHPWRKNSHGVWFFSPHFHNVGFGFVKWNRSLMARHKFKIKRISERGSRREIAGTIKYQLTHAGVHNKYHTVTWFGCCNYAKLKVDGHKKTEICPFCKQDIMPFEYVGDEELPDCECYFLDAYDKWRVKDLPFHGRESKERVQEDFGY